MFYELHQIGIKVGECLHQQFAERVFTAVLAKLCLCLGGGALFAGSPRYLLLHLAEGLSVDDHRMAVVDVVFGKLAHVLFALMGEQVGDIGLLQQRVAYVLCPFQSSCGVPS